MEQGDPKWLALRCGKITGSRFRAVMDIQKRTGHPNAARRKLIETLRQEIRTGVPEYTEPNEFMRHGTAMEPLARKAYEFLHDCVCDVPAFIAHRALDYIGFSPDGLIGDDGMIEIKCPYVEARHTRTIESQQCPGEYWPQVQGGLWITDRPWCDFVSYFPSISVEVVRVERDDRYIARLASECTKVWDEANTTLSLKETA